MILDTVPYRFYSNESASNIDSKKNTPQKVSENRIIYNFLFLTLKMPPIENFDTLKNYYIWQHVMTVGVFSELHSQETFVGHILVIHDQFVCRVNYCWSSPAQSFLIPGPAGLMTIFLCLTRLWESSNYSSYM
jgi:hypothetical protein